MRHQVGFNSQLLQHRKIGKESLRLDLLLDLRAGIVALFSIIERRTCKSSFREVDKSEYLQSSRSQKDSMLRRYVSDFLAIGFACKPRTISGEAQIEFLSSHS